MRCASPSSNNSSACPGRRSSTTISRRTTMDIVIRNGTIVDGSGLPGYRGDVGIDGGRIVSVGRPLSDADGDQVIDASGRVVAPGFVDPHTHLDAQLLFDPFVYPT